MVAMDEFAGAFGLDGKTPGTWTTLGKVTAVSGNTITAMLGGSSTATGCEAYCPAAVGDVVFVVVTDGKARAVACRGGGIVTESATVTASADIANYITAANCTISELTFERWGKVAMLRFAYKLSAALAANGTVSLGTVASAYRPATQGFGGNSNVLGAFGVGGGITVRNVSGASISTSSSNTFTVTYMLP